MRHVQLLKVPATTISSMRRPAGRVVEQLVREGHMDVPVSGYLMLKRVVDIALAVCLAVPVAAVTCVAWAVVRLTSRGPGLYTQTRVGLGGRAFTIFKLRTMVDNCESLTGPRWCVPGDPRVTPVGRVLRKLHIDELPQLFNVFKGDMSLVGPRPERPEFVEKLARELPHYPARHAVYPGITGLAQLHLPPDTEVADVERKLVYDLHYARRVGFWLDLRILLATGLKLLGIPAPALRGIVAADPEAEETVALAFAPTRSRSKAA